MHVFKRSPRILEQIQLGDELITIDLDVESVAMEFNRRQNAIVRAEQEMRRLKAENSQDITAAAAVYGEAVVAMLQLVFGEPSAAKILAFYENRYIELTLEVFPFILDVVAPKMKKALQDARSKAADMYRRARK